MPELPDIEVYLACLAPRILGTPLEKTRLASPFLLRTATPPLASTEGKIVQRLHRLGKQLVFALEGELFLILHLMIAGRLHWRQHNCAIPKRRGLAAFDFPRGTLLLTEAGSKRRAALHLVQGKEMLPSFDRGGLEVINAERAAFQQALQRENHTLKRALTDPRLFAGIGGAYADEIMHRAHLSPIRHTQRLDEKEIDQLHRAARDTLVLWTERLRQEAGDGFLEKVTAFHEGMAVHGRYGLPCPECHSPIQRIVYAKNETNYCPTCQTEGTILADRALSRLLKADWPRTLEELEERRIGRTPESAKS